MRELFQGNDPHMIQRNAPEYVGLCNFCPIIVVSNVLGKPTTIGAWTAKERTECRLKLSQLSTAGDGPFSNFWLVMTIDHLERARSSTSKPNHSPASHPITRSDHVQR